MSLNVIYSLPEREPGNNSRESLNFSMSEIGPRELLLLRERMGVSGGLGGVVKEEREGQEEVNLPKNFSIASLMAENKIFKGQENAEENIKRLAKGETDFPVFYSFSQTGKPVPDPKLGSFRIQFHYFRSRPPLRGWKWPPRRVAEEGGTN